MLGLLPDGIDADIWQTKLTSEFGDCVAVRNVKGNDITAVCEIEGVTLDTLFGCLTFENPHLVDVSSRIHTRTDIEW